MADPERESVLALARVSICIALRDENALRGQYRVALHSGVGIPLLREAVLQSYLFAGYAAAINAFVVLNELDEAKDSPFLREEDETAGEWAARGEDLCRKIYGSQYEKLVHNMKHLHPDLADWMIREGYGKVLSRPFLSPAVRELLIVGMTAALQVERQFYSHVRGALNVGAEPQLIRLVLEQVKPYIAAEAFQHYELILNGLLSEPRK